MQFALYATATTLVVDLPQRADATPTFVVKDRNGGTTLSSTAVTLDAVNTTLNGAVAAGATSFVVTSATGLVVGRRYLLAGAESVGGEWITVKSVSGTTVTPAHPVLRAKATLATVQGTRCTCALTAASVPTIGRHSRVEVSWLVSTAAQPTFVVPFDVTRYYPQTSLTAEDLFDADALLTKRMPAGTWMPAQMARAWEMILRRLAAKKDPGALVGAVDLTIPHGYLTRSLLAETGGSEWAEYTKDMRARFAVEFEAACAAAAFDDDQDGTIEPHEGWESSISISRG